MEKGYRGYLGSDPSEYLPTKKVKIFVGGVPNDCTNHLLRTYFLKFGPISHARIEHNRKQGASGYAYIFTDGKTAEAIVRAPHYFGDGLLNCKYALSKEAFHQNREDDMKRRLFVNQLPLQVTEPELYNFFCEWGEVEKAYLVRSKEDGSFKPFGFVIFRSQSDLEYLIGVNPVLIFKDKTIRVQRAMDRKTQTEYKSNYGLQPSHLCSPVLPPPPAPKALQPTTISQQARPADPRRPWLSVIIHHQPSDLRFNLSENHPLPTKTTRPQLSLKKSSETMKNPQPSYQAGPSGGQTYPEHSSTMPRQGSGTNRRKGY